MPKLGAHVSIAGGFHRAIERAVDTGCDCVQIFTGSTRQFPKMPTAERSGTESESATLRHVTVEQAELFTSAVSGAKIHATLAHASYLINMASPDDALWEKSICSMRIEIERAGELNIPWVVVHPGSYTTSTPEEGIVRIVEALQIVAQTRSLGAAGILLENTAGQGTNLGWDFRQLAEMIEGCSSPDWLGVCLDTCHAFAAGYAIDRSSGWNRMLAEIGGTFGFDSLKALHLNDSKQPCGSRVDRHEHIGLGHIGEEGFRRVVRSRKMGHLPMYLETPKAAIDGEEGDIRNLRVLRHLTRSTSDR